MNSLNGTKDMRTVKLHLGYAGFCWAKAHHALQGGKNMDIKFPALWALIDHPDEGLLLFDTGYTQRFYTATQSFPNKIYALATKVEVEKKDEIKNQLTAAGISPTAIKKIIISHFHADHVGGLLDFPDAVVYTSRKALEYTLSLNKRLAFTRGVLKALLPQDLASRTRYIEDQKIVGDPIFGSAFDIFNDNSILAYELPGHARGQIGIRLQTRKQRFFLIADACWLKPSYAEGVLPHPIVRLFFDSWAAFKDSLGKVHEFHLSHPGENIVPSHCQASTGSLISNTINFDKL
jgi:glyoxylase-like metal-dependent hydrolase (beta-lactamase superfamily II)